MATLIKRIGLRRALSKAGAKESESQTQLHQNLFSYRKCCEHGFPSKPSTFSFDPMLGLLAVATRTGAIRVYGRPGVYLSAQHAGDLSVLKICFIPGESQLITLCSNNSLHLWEISNNGEVQMSNLQHVKTATLTSSSLKSAMVSWCLMSDGQQLLLGDESGDLHFFDLNKFQLTEQTLYQDRITLSLSNDARLTPGVLESIVQSPTDSSKILIGYSRGLILLWDLTEKRVIRAYHSDQQLESLSFIGSLGRAFVSAHSDGSYMVWSVEDSTSPQEDATSPYGPFPCMAINKMEWYNGDSGDPLLIFTGGMPRANYGDRHTLSLMNGDEHVVLDMTSKIIDFITVSPTSNSEENESSSELPHSLLILAEEELIAIDLHTDGWPVHRLPYMCSIHSSPITCIAHADLVPQSFYNKLKHAGRHLFENFSARDWPIQGGTVTERTQSEKSLLLTGHEDGSVRFWDVTSGCTALVYQLNTAQLFDIGTNLVRTDSSFDVEWPPFRKVGWYDPFTDDPRLAIQNLIFCPLSETLLVTGQSGQVILHQFEREERDQDVKISVLNLRGGGDVGVGNNSGGGEVIWRSYAPLDVRTDDMRFRGGFQPIHVLQALPPVKCTAIGFQPEWQLLGIASEYGFGLFDFAQKKTILSFSSCSADNTDGATDTNISRSRSWRRSIRQSMRSTKLYRSVSAAMSRRKQQRMSVTESRVSDVAASSSMQTAHGETATPHTGNQTASTSSAHTPASSRQGDALRTPGGLTATLRGSGPFSSLAASKLKPSTIRSVYFSDSFILSGQAHTPLMWLGTSTGQIFAYRIQLPSTNRRQEDAVVCTLAKAVCLRHGAAIVNLCVIDRTGRVLPGPLEAVNQRAKPADMTGGHQLVVCTQQQLKIFQLPSLKALNKFKLSSLPDDSPILLSAFANFTSSEDETYTESDVVCLTRSLNIGIFSLPQLRPQLPTSVTLKDYASGLGISALSRNALGFYLSSFSELQQFTLSAHSAATQSLCSVTPAENSRRCAVRSRIAQPINGVGSGGGNMVSSSSEGWQTPHNTFSASSIAGPQHSDQLEPRLGDRTTDQLQDSTVIAGDDSLHDLRNEHILPTQTVPVTRSLTVSSTGADLAITENHAAGLSSSAANASSQAACAANNNTNQAADAAVCVNQAPNAVVPLNQVANEVAIASNQAVSTTSVTVNAATIRLVGMTHSASLLSTTNSVQQPSDLCQFKPTGGLNGSAESSHQTVSKTVVENSNKNTVVTMAEVHHSTLRAAPANCDTLERAKLCLNSDANQTSTNHSVRAK